LDYKIYNFSGRHVKNRTKSLMVLIGSNSILLSGMLGRQLKEEEEQENREAVCMVEELPFSQESMDLAFGNCLRLIFVSKQLR